MKYANANRFRSGIIYRGPSLLDGAPIVVIAIQTKKAKANGKTGAMVQTYIIREDMDPRLANKTGADFSICGNCVHRGQAKKKNARGKQAFKRSCYVQWQGVLVVWRAFQRGYYQDVSGHDAIAFLGQSRKVRLGTYGDPSAVPSYIWESLLSRAEGHTGYSHQANVAGADFRPDLFMQSVDNAEQARAAWALGRRTFRVLRNDESPIVGKEIDCPSSRGVHCTSCGLCRGAHPTAKSITIPAHGVGKANFNKAA